MESGTHLLLIQSGFNEEPKMYIEIVFYIRVLFVKHTVISVCSKKRCDREDKQVSAFNRPCSLAEKSVRKDEKTLFWPPPIIALLVTKSTGNKTAQK